MVTFLLKLRERLEPAGIGVAELLALCLLCTASIALTAALWWTGQPRDLEGAGPRVGESEPEGDAIEPLGAVPSTSTGGDGAAPGLALPAAGPDSSPVIVHVDGAVGRPGIVTLPAGSRVADAVDAAGGPTADAVLAGVNLARLVTDGEQIVVPDAADPVVPPPSAQGPAGPAVGPTGLLDLNAATAQDLRALPGIGEVTATRIVEHRDRIGGFVDVSQLLEVSGIGPARFAELERLVEL